MNEKSDISKVHKQEHQENQTLKIDIDQLRSQLEQTESSLDTTKHELKKTTKETNLKINELTKERMSKVDESSEESVPPTPLDDKKRDPDYVVLDSTPIVSMNKYAKKR